MSWGRNGARAVKESYARQKLKLMFSRINAKLRRAKTMAKGLLIMKGWPHIVTRWSGR